MRGARVCGPDPGGTSTPPLLAHEVAHAFIEEIAGLANEGAGGAVAEGLACFFPPTWSAGCERCEPTCEEVELLPNESQGNGHVVKSLLELLAAGGRYPPSAVSVPGRRFRGRGVEGSSAKPAPGRS